MKNSVQLKTSGSKIGGLCIDIIKLLLLSFQAFHKKSSIQVWYDIVDVLGSRLFSAIFMHRLVVSMAT